jgi:structure-specific recognition protein 1
LHGFRDADVASLRERAATFFPEAEVSTVDAAVGGKNWGEAAVAGNQLTFSVGAKPAFSLDCADISAVSQPGKTDVLLEFAVEDAAAEKDTLFELSFHVPLASKAHLPADGEELPEGAEAPPPAKVLSDALLARASVGPTTGEPIATFADVAVLIPRGRYSLELHGASLRLLGQAADFKIQYSSILRLFILPRPNNPTTLAVLSLDPPIRRGATHYPHLVLQFNADEEVEMEPSVPLELTEKLGGKLEASYTGAEVEVFAKVLRALAGTKVTRAGSFLTPSGAPAVRCVHKADDGHLYPLEKAFFFLPKPTLFIRHDEVQEIEFERSSGSSGKTFDLKISLTSDQTFRFSGVAKSEYDALVAFFAAKKLHVASLDAPRRDAAELGLSESDDDGLLFGAGAAGDGSDSEEDVDFKAEPGAEDDDGEPSSESEEDGDGDGTGGDADAKQPKAKKRKEVKEENPAKEGKAKRAKKDPNAPKRGAYFELVTGRPEFYSLFLQALRHTCSFRAARRHVRR